jgi:hypothetical protein
MFQAPAFSGWCQSEQYTPDKDQYSVGKILPKTLPGRRLLHLFFSSKSITSRKLLAPGACYPEDR